MESARPELVVDLVGTLEQDWPRKRAWLGLHGCALRLQLSREEIEAEAARQLFEYIDRDVVVARIPPDERWMFARGWLLAHDIDIGEEPLSREEVLEHVGSAMYEHMKHAVGGGSTIEIDLPVTGAPEAIAELSRDFTIRVLSTRKESQRGAIRRWLDRYFPGLIPDESLELIGKSGDKGTPKIKLCLGRSPLPFALIDDDKRHFSETRENVRGVLLNLDGRRTEPPGGAVAVGSWMEAVAYLQRELSAGA